MERNGVWTLVSLMLPSALQFTSVTESETRENELTGWYDMDVFSAKQPLLGLQKQCKN